MTGGLYVHDHPVHFYHLSALDWVDVVIALSANVSATEFLANSLSLNDPAIDFTVTQQSLQNFVDSGKLGPFAGGYWGTMPTQASGIGLNEAPRGALGYWINIDNQKIGNYQMVVPSTWNLGPRCSSGSRGPVEEALVGTPVANPEEPVEILRIVHFYDPCIACAVHVTDNDQGNHYKIKVL